MDSARRLYLYTLCGISLTLLTLAGVNLLSVLLDTVYWQFSDARLLSNSNADSELRQQASVYASIALVTLPVWALHWWLAQRAVASDAEEAQATLRALFRAGVLSACIIAVTVAATDLIHRAIAQVAITPRFSFANGDASASRSIAILLVVGTVGVYHARALRPAPADAHGRVVGAAGWLQRIPGLLALSIALGMLLSGSMRLLGLLVSRLGWSGDVLADSDVWARTTADAAGVALVGLALGLPFWLTRTRLQTAPDSDRGALRERQSSLWRLWLVLATAIVAAIGIGLLHEALFRSLQWLFLDPLGADEDGGGVTAISAFVRSLPPLALTTALLVWVARSRQAFAEPLDDADAGTLRAQWYGLTAVGLAMLGSGLVLLGMAVIDANDDGRLLGGNADFPQHALLRAIALTAVGLALWSLAWLRSSALQQSGAEAARERRGYLLLVIGAALVVCLSAGAVLLYTILQRLLDATPSDESSVTTSLITLAVAVPILLLHALAWRNLPEAPARITSDAAATSDGHTLRLVLDLPPDANPAQVLDRIRQSLPEGAVVRSDEP